MWEIGTWGHLGRRKKQRGGGREGGTMTTKIFSFFFSFFFSRSFPTKGEKSRDLFLLRPNLGKGEVCVLGGGKRREKKER